MNKNKYICESNTKCKPMKRTVQLSKYLSVVIAILMAPTFISCSDDDKQPQKKMEYITDSQKIEMLNSIKDLDGTGRLYEINYTVDYQLDKVLAAQRTSSSDLFEYVAYLLYDKLPEKKAKGSYGAGCSVFAVPEEGGSDFLMGRNYDFRHSTSDGKSYLPTSAILVHTAPAGGKKSISMVDGLNLFYGQGFYTNPKVDLSLLMGLPYAALDGINEDGFAIGILALKEKQTKQNTGKSKIGPTVAIRMLLDRASTVKEAINMLRQYDMDMENNGTSNYHYFMADATGDFAIVEYTKVPGDSIPSIMEVFTKNDTLRCVTNFYVSPTMIGTNDGWGSDHGKDRYNAMRKTLHENNYALQEDDAMGLLNSVSQPPTEELTSQTQWSSLYNLTERSLRLCILREYAKEYKFKVD